VYNKSMRERLLASTIICGAALLAAAPAFAQDDTEVAAVVVTGSRIPQPNLTSVSPLTVVNDQELKLQGTTNVESLLNSLPQVVVDQTSTVSNGASGTATVNLRGLGPSRTLVLVDGRRLMPGDPASPYADLNNIPAALVERVDVVTGGASAVYGSDAVAGVVNFIMKRDFEGIRLDAQYEFGNHTNDNTFMRSIQGVQGASTYPRAPSDNTNTSLSNTFTAIIGVNAPDGKGNVTGYVGYTQLKPILQSQYDISACSLGATNVNDPDSYHYDGARCFGSNANSAYGRFQIAPADRYPGSFGATRFHVATNGSPTFTSAAVPAYNYGPLNYFQRPDTRYTAGFFAHYQVNDKLDVYSDFMFSDDHTVAQIAPSGLFAGAGPNGTSTYAINCNNPLLTVTQQGQLCGTQAGTSTQVHVTAGFRFANPVLPRQDDLRHTQYKIDLGARGEFAEGWNYDVYAQYGSSVFNEHYNNDASTTKIQNALLVDPGTGQCYTDAANCVPLDIFQYGGLTQAMLDYVVVKGFKTGETTEAVVSGSITGDLGQYGVKTPWATDGVGVAFGAEYRRETLVLNVDNEFLTGDLSGQGGATLPNAGSFDVYELFGEARIPIVEDAAWAKNLSLELGYRFSDYSLSGQTDSYKVSGEWAINDDIRLRAGYNRAVRAPNIVELFTSQTVGLFSGNDPCAGAAPTASLATCTASGLAPALYGTIGGCPAGQCSALYSGNTALKPEEADTYTYGFVFTPTFIPGFNLSVDYFDIKVDGLIGSNPGATTLACGSGVLSACALFHRDPGTGELFGNSGYVLAQTINTGFVQTKGVDVSANYKTSFADLGVGDWGGLAFNLTGTWTDELLVSPVTGAQPYDCAGLHGPTCVDGVRQGGPNAKWKHRFRVTWTPTFAPVTLSAVWRYVGESDGDFNQSSIYLANHPSGVTDTRPEDNHIDAYNYLDISGTWNIRDGWVMRFGMDNVFDRDPPVLDANVIPVAGSGNGNTFPGTYDVFGRTVFVGITADF
jgi:outer membrane receptor protein involved in Fe transport